MIKKMNTANFEKALTWLHTRKTTDKLSEDFGYPDYGGMPKSITAELRSDEVDAIQEIWDNLRNRIDTKSKVKIQIFLPVEFLI